MLITELELQNFRNYEKQKIEFNNNINIFYGDNAQGKTNIIESIFISAFGKSFRTSKEKELIKYTALTVTALLIQTQHALQLRPRFAVHFHQTFHWQ